MGVNNRARRAAKRRKRATGRQGHPTSGTTFGWPHEGLRPDDRAVAGRLLLWALQGTQDDLAAARPCADRLTGPDCPVAPALVAEAMGRMLAEIVTGVVRGGWRPSDLAEVTGRRLSTRHAPPLAALLAAETDRHPRSLVAPAWREDLATLGHGEPAELTTADGLALALGLCAILTTLPVIPELLPPPGTLGDVASPGAGADAKLLGKVRSLLAKAESTDFPEEAEALSAKAQELISRYALDRLVHESAETSATGSATGSVTSRRLWIDPPYVLAKAMLVDVVAGANRCRSVVSEKLGFSTVIGAPSDLDVVDVLVTSLLVQANTAMLRHGRDADRRGTSRTTSFRRSFLMAYATRIGERLQAVTRDAVSEAGRSGALVPVLRRRAEQVEAVTEQLFPNLVSRETNISNGYGWAAGRAAADLALLDADLAVTEAAS